MKPRLALPSSLLCLLLALSGCASQQIAAPAAVSEPASTVDADARRQLAALDARLGSNSQSAQNLIGELGRKLENVNAEMRGLREALAARPALGRELEEARRLLDQRAAQASHAASDAALARDAEVAALEERLEAAEDQVAELLEQAEEAATQSSDRQAALETKLDAAGQRLEQIAARLEAQAGLKDRLEQLAAQTALRQEQQDMARNADAGDHEERLEALEADLEEMLEQGLETGNLLSSLPDTQAKAEAASAGLQGMETRLAGIDQRLEEDLFDLFERVEAGEETLDALETRAGQADADILDQRARSAAADTRLAALEKRLEEVAQMAQDALDATGLGQRKIYGKVVDSSILTEDKTLFPLNSPDLGEADLAKLDALAARVKALGTAFHLSIQGHTDGIGSDDYNFELGKARAEVVKHYLNAKHGIPLLRMSVISHGALEAKNSAPGSNRRIVVQLLQ